MCLTLEERGAYNTILDLIYSHANNLLDDDRFIAGWLRCDLRVWRRIKLRLIELGKIELRDGLIMNFRATSEIDEALGRAASVQELNRIKGIKSGIARRKNNGLDEPPVEPKSNTPTPTPTPIEEKKDSLREYKENGACAPSPPKEVLKNRNGAKPPKAGTRLSEDWLPLDDDADKVVAWGLTDEELRYEHEQFMAYWLAKTGKDATKLNWDLTWQKWMRKAAHDKREKQHREKAWKAVQKHH